MGQSDTGPLDAAEAVARLMEDEAAARIAVQRHEAAATREAEGAREAARLLLARADRRIEAAATNARSRLERELAQLRGAAQVLEPPGSQPDARAAHLPAAIERLAARLTTPDDGPAG